MSRSQTRLVVNLIPTFWELGTRLTNNYGWLHFTHARAGGVIAAHSVFVASLVPRLYVDLETNLLCECVEWKGLQLICFHSQSWELLILAASLSGKWQMLDKTNLHHVQHELGVGMVQIMSQVASWCLFFPCTCLSPDEGETLSKP